MRPSFTHYSTPDLLARLATLIARDRSLTVELIACIAEVDRRGLFRPAGYDSMYEYCVREFELSDDAALKRIRAARAAQKYPTIYDALADGRLHLTAIAMLAKHLTPENAEELLTAAEHKTCGEIARLIAERFPRPDLPERVVPLNGHGVSSSQTLLAARPVEVTSTEHVSPGAMAAPLQLPIEERAKLTPLSAERFGLQMTIPLSAYEKLRYIQELLSHAVPSGDLAEVHERAYDALIAQLEKQKFAATSRPGPQRSSADPRRIPARVKRAVVGRDGGQCTFVAESGHRCESRKRLEFDHVDPVAIGGEATVDNIRLRCRAHNQFEAECVFGAGFMESKRESARHAAAEKQARAAEKRAQLEKKRAQEAEEKDPDRSVVPWLRQLGCGLEDAREAAAFCATMPPEATTEERIRAALRFLAGRRGRAEKRVGTAA